MELNDSELIMTQICALHLTENQGMKLFKQAKITQSRATYYNLKGKVSALTKRRLTDIARELPEEHLKTMDLIILIEQRLIAKMVTATDDMAMARIAKIIVEIQPYKSAYQEGAKFALQELEKRELEQKGNSLSILA